MNILLEILRCPLHPDSGILSLVKMKKTPVDSEVLCDKGLKCQQCGSIYPIIDNIPDMIIKDGYENSFLKLEAEQWDSHSAIYDKKRVHSPVYMAGIDAAVEALQPKKADFVLDAACGTGLTIKKYKNQDISILALDISMESLRYLRDTLNNTIPIYFVRGDLCALPFCNEIFDKVLCANAITQISKEDLRRNSIRELARVAKPKSRLVITVHNLSITKKRKGWRKEGSTGSRSGSVQYIYRYEHSEFQSLLASFLSVEKIIGAGFPLPYRFKLSALSHRIELFFRHFKASASCGNMLVGTCYKS